MTYTRKLTVEAQQFLVESVPWPDGVVVSEESVSGYSFHPDNAANWAGISPGDYVVQALGGPKVMRQAEFEDRYEV